MTQLILQLPEELVERLRAEAERRHTTAEELVASQAALIPVEIPSAPKRTMASFWGVGSGRSGAHGSVEAVDAFIRDLRDEWE